VRAAPQTLTDKAIFFSPASALGCAEGSLVP
jgi:hypothetical protein